MSVGIYVRVSTVGQNEAGQRAEIERWLKGNGIKGAKWYLDKESGDTLQRPAFERLQADVFSGQITTIIVWKLDRLSRSMRDGINVLCDWLDRELRFVSVTQGFDFKGAIGKMIAALLFGVAEMEQETRRERQAAGIAVAKQNGVYNGRKAGTTKAKPDRAKQLQDRGLSVGEIAKSLGVSERSVHRYLAAQ
jgi:DNA invertase Pin-like site-specific DNA recombinase